MRMISHPCTQPFITQVEGICMRTKIRRHRLLDLSSSFRKQNTKRRLHGDLSNKNCPISCFVQSHELATLRHKSYTYGSYFSTNSGDSDSLDEYDVAQLLESASDEPVVAEEPKLPTNVKGLRRRLDIAIVGLPNAGKSQLLNVLTGSSVSAVSRKRHTTRQGIMAAKTVTKEDDKGNATTTQLLFVDTPGFVNVGSSSSFVSTKSKGGVKIEEKIGRDLMISEARREMVAVDYTILVIDAARRFTPDVRAATVELMMLAIASQGRIEDIEDDEDDVDDNRKNDIDTRKRTSEDNGTKVADDEIEVVNPLQKFAIVLNKVDLIHPKSKLLEFAFGIGDIARDCLQFRPPRRLPDGSMSEGTTEEIDLEILTEIMPTFFYISALQNDGVDDLISFLLERSTPSNVFELEPGTSTNMIPEERAEEIIREKIYRCLHKEIPYQITQQNRIFKVVKDEKSGSLGLYIEQDLLVASKTHQEIVHGKGNQTLERIRETAEHSMKLTFKCDVTLKLRVKLEKSNNRRRET